MDEPSGAINMPCTSYAIRREISRLLRYLTAFIWSDLSPSEDRPIDPELSSDIRIAGTNFVEKGNRLHLTCNATGDDYRPDAIDWFKDGIKMSSFDIRRRISIDVSLVDKTIISQLTIRRTVMSDSGTYVCRTSDQQITSLKVNILNTETNNEKRDMNVKDKITDIEIQGSGAAKETVSLTFAVLAAMMCVLFIGR
ncbi:uncharacterized protein LOC121379734 [Gigantopelta aegis]|uniref:uncharacterized protein LOC121379734 n=1 Tax=Gigantopelta aegis TaxID=1735272 RepID=UPI001B88D5C9|nr:uncharacterized protein LOC121379734 [Gigantopelta aegis]